MLSKKILTGSLRRIFYPNRAATYVKLLLGTKLHQCEPGL
jgi:hypothetical protein